MGSCVKFTIPIPPPIPNDTILAANVKWEPNQQLFILSATVSHYSTGSAEYMKWYMNLQGPDINGDTAFLITERLVTNGHVSFVALYNGSTADLGTNSIWALTSYTSTEFTFQVQTSTGNTRSSWTGYDSTTY